MNVANKTPELRNDSEKVAYVTFRDHLKRVIDDVNGLGSGVVSQWSSPISMAYHWKKHNSEFKDTPISMHDYFVTLCNDLFESQNATGSCYSQDGCMLKKSYAKSLKKLTHVGFTYGENEIRTTLYTR